MTELSRRAFMTRIGVGAGGLVLLSGGGRAFAGTPLGLPPTTNPGELSHFGHMFSPSLAVFGAGFTTARVLDDIDTMTSPVAGSPMVEPGGVDDTLFGAQTTYMGQFALAHDLTLDASGTPTRFVNPASIENLETFFLDLSSMYGGGPRHSPQMYTGARFLTQTNSNGVADLPRRANGTAIIVELRDDENEITSQLLYGFQQFHNYVVDTLPAGRDQFKTAAAIVRHYFQWIIVHEWLPQIIGQSTVNGLLNGSIRRFYNPGNRAHPMTPVEWSVAGQRLHSMVRNAYAVELTTNGTQSFPNNRTTLFTGLDGAVGANDLHGGRPLPASHLIDWGNFVNELARGAYDPANGTDSFLQTYKQLIPQLGASAFNLPIGGQTGAASAGSNILAQRDLVRGYFYSLPSGQAVATEMGIAPINPITLLQSLPTPVDPASVPSFAASTPLWLYVLAEAYILESTPTPESGFAAYLQPNKAGSYQPDHLGPVGSRIIGDVVLRVVQNDPAGILSDRFSPETPIAPHAGQFGLADLLVDAGVAAYP